jgi:glycosyltransferase involved in cell wall biosynthesis
VNILFLTDNFPPEVNAPASRTAEHCREWVRQGHRVTVITGVPNFPTGKIFAGYRNRAWQRETLDGIEVIRVWTYITANEGFFRRTLDYASFGLAATLAAPFLRDVDVIVATSPQFFTACAGWLAGVIKRRPFVFELRDLWPESIRAVGAMKDGALIRDLERIELFLYRRAAAIVTVTHSFRSTLMARGIDGSKIKVVTNGADLDRFRPRAKDSELARRLGLEHKIVAGYVGTHGLAHALDTVLEAAARIKKLPAGNAIRFVLLGDGAAKKDLQAQAARLKLDNVLFLDTVPKAEVARYWSLMDISIIHLKKDPLFTAVIPSKLFECMAMGIPVLHGVAGESARIVEREQVGLPFEPEDAGALAEHTLRLAHDHDLRRKFAARGVAAARRYDRKALATSMLATLEALAAARASTAAGSSPLSAASSAELRAILPWKGRARSEPGWGGRPSERSAAKRRRSGA